MSLLPVPVVVIITGEGASGGALGTAVGDRVYMLEHSYYSVISPEGCASILWRDAGRASEAAKVFRFSAKDMLQFGIIEGIIPEPLGGAHRDPELTASRIKHKLLEALAELVHLPPQDLLDQRYQRFRKLGKFTME
jgi:acetyl-CoA carboxylase carboxyl transferase subunit alpha